MKPKAAGSRHVVVEGTGLDRPAAAVTSNECHNSDIMYSMLSVSIPACMLQQQQHCLPPWREHGSSWRIGLGQDGGL